MAIECLLKCAMDQPWGVRIYPHILVTDIPSAAFRSFVTPYNGHCVANGIDISASSIKRRIDQLQDIAQNGVLFDQFGDFGEGYILVR